MNRGIRVTREAIERRSEARSEAAQRQADFIARRRPGNDAIIDLQQHVADADPHPQYLTDAEADAAYQPLDADLTAIAGLTGEGVPWRSSADAWALFAELGFLVWTTGGPDARVITGTANEITVANGSGASGDPTISLPSALTFTGKTVTGGSFSGPALTGTPTAPTAAGGTNTTQVATTAFVTSAISTAGAGYQPAGNDLTAVDALSGTGFSARTATDTWALRSLSAPAAGLTITNPAGVAGNPTFALANDLSALEGLSGTGFSYRSGTDTWSLSTTDTFGTLSGVINNNLITNGAAEIWQRGTSFALASGTKTKTLDMFHVWRNATNGVCERAAGFAGARYSIELRKNAGTGTQAIFLHHQIESAVATQLAGKTIFISFDALRGSSYDGNGISVVVFTGTGTDETFTASTGSFVSTTTTTNGSSALGLATTTTHYVTSVTVPSDCTEMVVRLGATQTSTAGDANHYVRITNWHVGLNFAPAGFDREPLALTWSRCLRRYWKTFLEATAPAQNAGAGTGEHIAPATIAGANVNTLGTVRFPVPMRAVPTGVSYNPAAASAEARDLTNAVNCTATTIQNITTKSAEIIATGNAATTVGARLGVHLGFDAEFA